MTEHNRASGSCITKQLVGRLGFSEREAEVVRQPDAAGKKRQHCRTRQLDILPFFLSARSSPHQAQPFISKQRERERGGYWRTYNEWAVLNLGLVIEYATMQL